MISTIADYLQYPFVRNALIAGILVSFCASLLGVTLVLKRFSFIGDGLSHAAFGAMAIAAVLRVNNNMIVVMPITVICAVLILRTGNGRIKGDASVAMLSVGALAIGYLLLNMFPTSTNISGDVCSTLFGSSLILTLSTADVWISVIMSIVLIITFVLFYNKLFAITFDEQFSAATGMRTGLYNTIIAVITAVVIVLAMNLAGSLLTSALIIFPALSAMRVFKSFKSVVICSAAVGVFSSALGIILSILASTPVGSTIVAVQIAVFIAFSAVGKLLQRG